MSIKPVGSIFDLSYNQVEFYTKRLVKRNDPQGHFGFASTTGFLDHNEGLLESGFKDRITLENRGLTYEMIAEKLEKIFQEVQDKLITVVDDKFIVARTEPCLGLQYCPFSPVSNEEISQFTVIQGACGQNNIDYTIHNINKKCSVMVSGLHVHLIRDHHFFEGQVLYRLDPNELIEILEIEPKTKCNSNDLSLTLLHKKPDHSSSAPEWKFSGCYYSGSPRTPFNLAKYYKLKVYNFYDKVVGLILPYPHGFDGDPMINVFNSNLEFLHLFNISDTTQIVSGAIDELTFTDIEIPKNKRWILRKPTYD